MFWLYLSFSLYIGISLAQTSTASVNTARCNTVLFLADDNNCSTEGKADNAINKYAKEAGFDVDFRCTLTVPLTEASNYAMMIVSQSADSGNVDGLVRANIPVVIYEENAFDEFLMGNGEQNTQTEVDILEPSHPLAAGFTGHIQLISNCTEGCMVTTQDLGSGATTIAMSYGTEVAVYTYEKGSMLADGSTTRALRIGLFMGKYSNVTDTGISIIQAAIGYAFNNSLCGEAGREIVVTDSLKVDQLNNILGHLVLETNATLEIAAGAILDIKGCAFLDGDIVIDGLDGDTQKLEIARLASHCTVDLSTVRVSTVEGCQLKMRQELQTLVAIKESPCVSACQELIIAFYVVISCLSFSMYSTFE